MNELADAKRAVKMSKYMKDQFQFLGIPSPLRKAILSDWIKLNRTLVKSDFRSIALALYDLPYREFQYCGMELLVKYKSQLHKEDIQLVEELILKDSWWDTVDLLASHCVGQLFSDQQLRDRVTAKWIASGNMWLFRSCVISQLKYKKNTDLDYLTRLIDQSYDSNEFFIQKANGWALRQASKFFPEEIKTYVESKTDWPRVTYKEAIKYL